MQLYVKMYGWLKCLFMKWPGLIKYIPSSEWQALWSNIVWEQEHIRWADEMDVEIEN